VSATSAEQRQALMQIIKANFDITPITEHELRPADGDGLLQLGYIDVFGNGPSRLTLKKQTIADDALAEFPEPYRHLDTAILERLLLTGPLQLTEDDISHLNRFGYSRSDEEALQMIESGEFEIAFFLRSNPVQQIRDIAATGVNMPPKSTFFYPKVPTGLLYNSLV
jgi:uncharacterized protein (DUF1015 family)